MRIEIFVRPDGNVMDLAAFAVRRLIQSVFVMSTTHCESLRFFRFILRSVYFAPPRSKETKSCALLC